MTVRTDVLAIAPTANARSVAVAHGAQLQDLLGLLDAQARQMQTLLREISKYHPPTTQSVTISGTVHAGDLITLSITPSGGALQAITYTVIASDTFQSIAINLANAVNRNSTLQYGTITASSPVAGAFNLSFGLTPTVTASVSGTGNTTTCTVGSASTGADPSTLSALNAVLAELL